MKIPNSLLFAFVLGFVWGVVGGALHVGWPALISVSFAIGFGCAIFIEDCKTKIVEVEKIVEKEVVKYVDRVVVGPPIAVKIYVAKTKNTERFAGLGSYVTEELHGYFLSCEEAFRAFPGKNVEEKDGLFIGGEYFLSSHAMNRVEVTKPRVAKGKK